MKILSIHIQLTNGADLLYFHTDLKEATWPFTADFVLESRAARDTGIEFVKKNFPSYPIEILNTRTEDAKFSRT